MHYSASEQFEMHYYVLKLEANVLSYLIWVIRKEVATTTIFSHQGSYSAPQEYDHWSKKLRSSRTSLLPGNKSELFCKTAGSCFFHLTFLFAAMLHHVEAIVLGDITFLRRRVSSITNAKILFVQMKSTSSSFFPSLRPCIFWERIRLAIPAHNTCCNLRTSVYEAHLGPRFAGSETFCGGKYY